jgi:ppGpp synthetase/RelA/SpoT-type nucleotidyltranferase
METLKFNKSDFDGLTIDNFTDIQKKIDIALTKAGLYFRLFSRMKSSESIKQKIDFKQYNEIKKLQDLLGWRIVFYFNDDVHLCDLILKKIFNKPINSTIDSPETNIFEPMRINYVFENKSKQIFLLKNIYNKYPIDNTFEIQVRTVFSEGWHENFSKKKRLSIMKEMNGIQ